MKICIDARSLGYSGVRTYASCLLPKLIEAGEKDQGMILSDRDDKWEFDGFEIKEVPTQNPLGWMIWSNTMLPHILEDRKVTLYHSLKHVTVFRGRTKKVITFHSARFFLYPEHYKWYDFAYLRTMYPAAAKNYDCVITVSEAEKRNYVQHMKIPENKFRVIHLAADERFQIIEDVEKLQGAKQKFNLPDRFILFVGRILPVKNIEGIIKAYHLAKKQRKLEHKLVLVGKATWHSKKLFNLVKELEMTQDVIFTGPIFDELPCVYNLAELFLFPSFYESFGGVTLEAMACGTPVIASNSGGLPEVVGDAAITVSPTNVNELSDSIVHVLSSNQQRQSMIKKGKERPGLFSWERCAREHRKIYDEFSP